MKFPLPSPGRLAAVRGGFGRACRWLVAGGLPLGLALAASEPAWPRVYRTMMPEAGPSAFAIQLAEGVGLCYDANRGGINYVWEGEFADLAPTTRAKINKPAELRGEIRYRESDGTSLRLAPIEAASSIEFKGYRLRPDAVEFEYLLDGVRVREELRALPEGRGLVRHFRFDAPLPHCYVVAGAQPGSAVTSPDGRWLAEAGVWAGTDRREFRVVINFTAETPR